MESVTIQPKSKRDSAICAPSIRLVVRDIRTVISPSLDRGFSACMPAEIRMARASDVDDLAAIEASAFQADRISRRSFRRLVGKDTAAILVSLQDRMLAGYCAVLFRADSPRARLYSIAAAPGVSGVGRLLLEAAEETAAGRGCKSLRLEVRQDNARAIALYEAAGYRRTGRVEGYYADGMTALRFEKLLSGGKVPSGAAPTHPDQPKVREA